MVPFTTVDMRQRVLKLDVAFELKFKLAGHPSVAPHGGGPQLRGASGRAATGAAAGRLRRADSWRLWGLFSAGGAPCGAGR